MITPLLRRHVPCGMQSQTRQIAKNQLPAAGFTLSFPPVFLLSFPPVFSGNPEIAKNRHGRILETFPFERTSGQASLCFSGRQRKAPPTLTLPLKGGGTGKVLQSPKERAAMLRAECEAKPNRLQKTSFR